MPPQLVEPLEFLFHGHLAPDDAERVHAIENLRAQLARRNQMYPTVSASSKPPADGAVIARRVSVPRAWGTFLFLCAKSFHAKCILEMGTGAGISAAYLSAAPDCQSLITIEGSAERAALAASNLQTLGAPAQVMPMDMNAALDDLFVGTDALFDLINLDGDHQYASTLHLAERVRPHLNARALLILDDIHWSQGMYAAWQKIRAAFGFAFALDVGRFGVCYWDGAPRETEYANLARYTGWFQKY